MNKFRLIIIAGLFALLSISPAMAQDLSSGSILISGETEFGYSNQKIEYEGGGEYTVSGFNLDVIGEYFLIDNISVAAYLGYGSESTKNGDEVKETEMKVGVGGNYYYDMQSELFPFAGAFLGYRSQKTSNGSDYTVSGIEFGFGGGVLYFLNEYALVKAGLKYSIGKGTAKNGSEVDVDVSELALYVGLGVKL
ncbi:outer membrane beta-barrel protein [candidate division CSSED10-310 bacterium]|uniref:Outer membrane beta-barrel protein n=1 Tax=candidate division CSSED10-310 bacterium TaxID=2855610 RepID=A0ABV6YXA3_UNCC1